MRTTVRRQSSLITTLIAAGLLAVVRLGNSKPVDDKTSIKTLMESNGPDRFGLVKHFKELGLDELCDLFVIDNSKFKSFVDNNNEPSCLCTVIYKMFKELEDSGLINRTDVELAIDSVNMLTDQSVLYGTWKRVSEESHSKSLKLLMNPLNDTNKWNKVCFNDKTFIKYCKFLSLEVLLLNKTLQTPKDSIVQEEATTKPLEKTLPNGSGKIVPGVPKDNLPEPKPEPGKIELPESKIQNAVFNGIDENLEEITTTKLANVEEDGLINQDQFDDQNNAQNPPETDRSDYPQESDDTITQPKESQVANSQKNTFTNRRYSGTEDSHFLFYFGILTVLSMVFYLALYNKKKIIALIIEGRRGTNHRKRPNTATYSKVETDDGSNIF